MLAINVYQTKGNMKVSLVLLGENLNLPPLPYIVDKN